MCDFRLKSPFVSEKVRDRRTVAMVRSQDVIDSLSILVGSDDLERGKTRISFFSSGYP